MPPDMPDLTDPIWERRSTEQITPVPREYDRIKLIVTITTTLAVGKMRIGVWDGEDLVVGYSVPQIPANSILTIDSLDRRVYLEGPDHDRGAVNNFVRSWSRQIKFDSIALGTYTLTVDQVRNEAVPVHIVVDAVSAPR